MKFSDLKDLFGNTVKPVEEKKSPRYYRRGGVDYPVVIEHEADNRYHVYAGRVRAQKGSSETYSEAADLANVVYSNHLQQEKDWPALREKDRANWKSNRRRKVSTGRDAHHISG